MLNQFLPALECEIIFAFCVIPESVSPIPVQCSILAWSIVFVLAILCAKQIYLES